ncbi:DUF7680 family protein [Halorussus litoreus]|uniref:DUF7680 family protein n=1 Tax=Halorussus litoreus TaxID=1710536 RepID=UPI000E243DED|nr:hypothetical protein [Halorussus litoreus]
MTARPGGASRASEKDGLDARSFGSSVYGGRPNFALARREDAEGATLALYELLPDEQAAARRERLERANRRLAVEPFASVFGDSSVVEAESWSWTDWSAVKVARLAESRLRSILPLIRESLETADVDPGPATGTGNGDVFLPEAVGVRLALAFTGVKPIQRVDRMRAFARGVARMSDEECYYWHAKCRSPSSPNGAKALRTLLTDHVK